MDNYILFSPEIEAIAENFDSLQHQINTDIKDYIHKSKSLGNASVYTRDAHAKGYAALRAEFRVLSDLPRELSYGLYAAPGNYEAVVRFSNGSSRVLPDKLSGNAQGLAIKVFGIPGNKLAPGEADSTNVDFNLINNPVFFCNSAAHYIYISKLFLELNDYFEKGTLGKVEFAYYWATKMGKAFPDRETLKELKALLSFQKIVPRNSLLYSFFSMGAVKSGEYMGKIRVKPNNDYTGQIIQSAVDVNRDLEAYGPVLINEIRHHDYLFDFQVQLCRDLEKQPINDLTVEWKEQDAPFVTVAQLYIPRQDVPDDGNFETMENLSFTPFRCLEENRPIGELQMSRLNAYQASSVARHQLNDKERREPKNLLEAFNTR